MWILVLTIYAVVLNDGTVVPLVPPKTAVIETYATLKTCEDERMSMTQFMTDRPEEAGTLVMECHPAKRTQL